MMSDEINDEPVPDYLFPENEDNTKKYVKNRSANSSISRTLSLRPSLGINRTTSLQPKNKYVKRSKSLGRGSVRLKAGESIDIDVFTNELLVDNHVEQDCSMQMETLKSTATNLSVKRKIRRKFLESTTTDEIGLTDQIVQSKAVASRTFNRNLAALKYTLAIWSKHLKKIEGNFGSSVSSYFEFLKWLLLWLNIPVFILIMGLVVIPQILYRFLQQNPSGYSKVPSFRNIGEGILTGGGGWLNATELYYGTYYNGSISFIGSYEYNMQNAYFAGIAASYGLTLIILLVKLGRSYRTNFIEAGDVLRFYYVNKIMAGWDHNITSESASVLKSRSILNELKEFLTQLRIQNTKKSLKTKCGLFFLRTFTTIIGLSIIACSSYLVHYIISKDSLRTDIPFISDLALPITLTAINYIIPIIFTYMSKMENYANPRNEQYMTMLRTVSLTYVTTGVALFYWLRNVKCTKDTDLLPDILSINTTVDNSSSVCDICWENLLGQKIYKFVIMDFIFIILITLVLEIFVKLISKISREKIKPPEFNIGRNILYLIYSQMLVWLGAYYSPMLYLIGIIKLILIFYLKNHSLLICCRPSKKPWRAGQINTIFIFILLISFIIGFLVFGYSIIFLTPSSVCGPYRGIDSPFSTLTNIFEGWRSEYIWITYIIKVVTTSEFISCVLVAFVVIIYYLSITSRGLTKMINLLNLQLSNDKEEKLLLLRLLPHPSIETSPSKSIIPQIDINEVTFSDIESSPPLSSDESPTLATVGNHRYDYNQANQGYVDTSLDPTINPYHVNQTPDVRINNPHANPQHYNMYP